MTLTLRKTVIKGETAHGDYLVLEDGKAIGRIRLGHGLNGAMRWYWNVTVHVLPEQRPVGETWKKPGPHSKRHGKEIVAYVLVWTASHPRGLMALLASQKDERKV